MMLGLSRSVEPGARTADYAGVTCASMMWIMGMSHIVTLDMCLTFFMTLALCGFVRAQHDGATRGETRRWMWIVWAGMAGALLTKGLIGLVFPLAFVFLYLALTRQLRLLFKLHLIPSAAVFLAIACGA